MAIRDQIYPVYKSRDFAACNRILDTVSPGKDREEWHSITYWRSTILEAEGHFNDALVVLEHGREGFDCRSLYAFMTTQLLVRLGRTAQATLGMADRLTNSRVNVGARPWCRNSRLSSAPTNGSTAVPAETWSDF